MHATPEALAFLINVFIACDKYKLIKADSMDDYNNKYYVECKKLAEEYERLCADDTPIAGIKPIGLI